MATAISRLSLKPGIHRFPDGTFGSTNELIRETNLRKHNTLLIACSEMGAAPDNLSFASPGQCVVLQHLAASIPSKTECDSHAELSFIEMEQLFDKYDFGHVVICGHLDCGVIRNWLKSERYNGEDIGRFRLRFENSTRRFVDLNYSTSSFSERCKLMICEHVLIQIENIMSHHSIGARVLTGQTSLHGWILDDKTARIFGYQADESAFIPM